MAYDMTAHLITRCAVTHRARPLTVATRNSRRCALLLHGSSTNVSGVSKSDREET